jgi:hypothetical protein
MYLVRNPQQSRSAILLKSTPLAALNCNYEPYIILELNFPAIYDTLPPWERERSRFAPSKPDASGV